MDLFRVGFLGFHLCHVEETIRYVGVKQPTNQNLTLFQSRSSSLSYKVKLTKRSDLANNSFV